MATLIKMTEVYRVNTEAEAEEFITAAKAEAKEKGYELVLYKNTYKEKKQKGEVVDAGQEITLQKSFNKFWEV